MAEIQDDRTPEQRQTHTVIVLATDTVMSGWGKAAHGASYAGWACRPEDSRKVENYVRSRSDMRGVRVVGGNYRPGPACVHLHVYVADPRFNMLGS